MIKKWFKYLTISLIILTIIEVGLRIGMDIGEKPLYEKNKKYEYCLQKNQNISRFHNKYQTNEYGMRSKSISSNDKKRVLLFGDSVLNGGTDIDQKATIPYVLEKKLSQYFQDSIGVYSISAGSWGVENAYRFLEEKIDFSYDAIGLIFSSHDFNDNMHHRDVVGSQPAWPNKQPSLAITDIIFNGIVPKAKSILGINNYSYLNGFNDSHPNPGFQLFIDFAQKNNIPLFVYIHPEKEELNNQAFNNKGQSIIINLNQNNIVNLSGLKYESQSDYLDKIHINSEGHLNITNAIIELAKTENILGFGKKK